MISGLTVTLAIRVHATTESLYQYLPLWNSRAIIPYPFWSRSPDLELFTNASGRLGFGIYFQGHWLNGSWPSNLSDCSIQWKELYPIALACLLWGPLWRGKKLLFHCDQSWTFEQRVLPMTPSLCTLFVQSSFALHPTNSLFLSLTFEVQTIQSLCFVPFSDVPVPPTCPQADLKPTTMPVSGWYPVCPHRKQPCRPVCRCPPSSFISTRHQADNWTLLLPPSTYHHVSHAPAKRSEFTSPSPVHFNPLVHQFYLFRLLITVTEILQN